MNYRIIFSRDAKADISSAVGWYGLKDPNLAFRFLLDLRATKLRITTYPYIFRLINGTFRRAGLKTFPYYIYFSLNIDIVFVIAVVHERRDDSTWKDRGNGYS